MRARLEGGRRAAGIAAGLILVAAGFGSAQALAGGARGKQVPTTTVTVGPGSSTTITTPPGTNVTVTVTVTIPSAPSTTATAPTVTSPPAPPPSAPPATPPPPPPPASSITPPPPPADTANPAPSPGSPGSGASTGSPEATADVPPGGSGDAAEGEAETSGTSSAGPVSLGRKPDAYRPPSQQRSHPVDARSGGSASSEYAAVGRAESFVGLHHLLLPDLEQLRTRKGDILSLLDFPDFLQRGRAQVTKSAGTGLPDVQRVLGEQATVERGGGGGGTLGFGELPLLALSLVLLSSLLLVGALLPAGVLARTPVSPARFARIRQPLALAAVAILIPLAVASLVAALG